MALMRHSSAEEQLQLTVLLYMCVGTIGVYLFKFSSQWFRLKFQSFLPNCSANSPRATTTEIKTMLAFKAVRDNKEKNLCMNTKYDWTP